MFTEYHLYTILATGKRMCASKSKWYFHSKIRTPGKSINHVVGLTHYSPGAIRFQNCLPFVPSNILYRDQTRLCSWLHTIIVYSVDDICFWKKNPGVEHHPPSSKRIESRLNMCLTYLEHDSRRRRRRHTAPIRLAHDTHGNTLTRTRVRDPTD